MKISIERQISLSEVDSRFEIRLRALINHLQHAAGLHSVEAGYGTRDLIARGHAWVLYRIAIRILRPPVFGDDLRIVTWHRGINRFRSYRDYEIRCQGETIAAATSVWLYIQLEKKRILKVPKDVAPRYTVEPDLALDIDLDGWRPDLALVPEKTIRLQTRASDYDPLGHVNNAVYFDYIETLLDQALPSETRLRQVVMQYNKEIPRTVKSVDLGLRPAEAGCQLILSSADTVHACADLDIIQA